MTHGHCACTTDDGHAPSSYAYMAWYCVSRQPRKAAGRWTENGLDHNKTQHQRVSKRYHRRPHAAAPTIQDGTSPSLVCTWRTVATANSNTEPIACGSEHKLIQSVIKQTVQQPNSVLSCYHYCARRRDNDADAPASIRRSIVPANNNKTAH